MTVLLVVLMIAGGFLNSLLDVVPLRVAFGAMFGGAAGNLIDGVRRGAITDFIDLQVWPVFNLADTAIVTGAVLAGWVLFVAA